MCCEVGGSLRRADHSSRGVLPSVVCLFECDCDATIMLRHWPTGGCCVAEGGRGRGLVKM